ncbi:MAG: Mn-Zn_transporter_SitD, partial [uncultured Corynebacteriales bacterium]
DLLPARPVRQPVHAAGAGPGAAAGGHRRGGERVRGAAPAGVRLRRAHPHRLPRRGARLPGRRGRRDRLGRAAVRGAVGGADHPALGPGRGHRGRLDGDRADRLLRGRGDPGVPAVQLHRRPHGIPVRPDPHRGHRPDRDHRGARRGGAAHPGAARQGAGVPGVRPDRGRGPRLPGAGAGPGAQPGGGPGRGGRGPGRRDRAGDRAAGGAGRRRAPAVRPAGRHPGRRGRRRRAGRLAGAGRLLAGLGQPRRPAGLRRDRGAGPGRALRPRGRRRRRPLPPAGRGAAGGPV